LRWVILTDDFAPMPGGVAMMATGIARALEQAGHEVHVFARRRPGLQEEHPFSVHPVNGPSFGTFGGIWLARKAWRHCLDADAIIGMTWPVSIGLAWALQGREIPFHVLFHGSEITNRPWTQRGFEKVCQRATVRWAVSDYLAGVLGTYGFDARRIPIPLDSGTQCADRLPPRPEDWLYVARATSLKGGERFLRLLAADRGARGTLVGDGPALAGWKQLASTLGVRQRVVFRGSLPPRQMREVMEAHDLCLLLPTARPDGSGAEGLGICLLEAALAGMAVVGCATGGVPEAVGAGLVLDAPDDVEASLAQIHGWWSPERGVACRQWVLANHGAQATAAALLRGVGAHKTSAGEPPLRK
jgi:glycosyltransferase involved in cell wall biosynthesis